MVSQIFHWDSTLKKKTGNLKNDQNILCFFEKVSLKWHLWENDLPQGSTSEKSGVGRRPWANCSAAYQLYENSWYLLVWFCIRIWLKFLKFAVLLLDIFTVRHGSHEWIVSHPNFSYWPHLRYSAQSYRGFKCRASTADLSGEGGADGRNTNCDLKDCPILTSVADADYPFKLVVEGSARDPGDRLKCLAWSS